MREREFIQGDIVLLQTHSDNTATVEQKFTKYKIQKSNINNLTIILFSFFMMKCSISNSWERESICLLWLGKITHMWVRCLKKRVENFGSQISLFGIFLIKKKIFGTYFLLTFLDFHLQYNLVIFSMGKISFMIHFILTFLAGKFCFCNLHGQDNVT